MMKSMPILFFLAAAWSAAFAGEIQVAGVTHLKTAGVNILEGNVTGFFFFNPNNFSVTIEVSFWNRVNAPVPTPPGKIWSLTRITGSLPTTITIPANSYWNVTTSDIDPAPTYGKCSDSALDSSYACTVVSVIASWRDEQIVGSGAVRKTAPIKVVTGLANMRLNTSSGVVEMLNYLSFDLKN